MDKRRLYEDIALIRKRIFASSAFAGFIVVGAASIAGKGFDFYTVFVNAALGMMIFGALGFALGFLYERLIEEPLIESYRAEAADRMTSHMESLEITLTVAELRPGMKVCDQVTSSEGATLVRPGTVLNGRLISVLSEEGIESVRVKAQRAPVLS